MPHDIQDLEQTIAAAADNAFGGLGLASLLKPLFDTALGDVGTDICIRAGALLRRSPSELSRAIMAELPEEVRTLTTESFGFLNLKLPSTSQWHTLNWSHLTPAQGRYAVVLPFAGTLIRGTSYLRLCSQAALEYLLLRSLGAKVDLLRADLLLDASEQATELDPLLTKVFSIAQEDPQTGEPSSDAERVRFHFGSALAAASYDRLICWYVPEVFDRKEAARLLGTRSIVDSLKVRGAERDWLGKGNEEALTRPPTSLTEAVMALLYLVSSVRAEALDFTVLLNKERANLAWYLGMTLCRAERLFGNLSITHDAKMKHGPTYAEVMRIPRARMLSGFLFFAAVDGEVRTFVAALEETLASFNQCMNSPLLRQELYAGTIAPEQLEIIAGARQVLSGIIQKNDVFRAVAAFA